MFWLDIAVHAVLLFVLAFVAFLALEWAIRAVARIIYRIRLRRATTELRHMIDYKDQEDALFKKIEEYRNDFR